MKQATDTAGWGEVADKIRSLQRKADELLNSLQAVLVSIPTPGGAERSREERDGATPLEPGAEVSA